MLIYKNSYLTLKITKINNTSHSYHYLERRHVIKILRLLDYVTIQYVLHYIYIKHYKIPLKNR